MPVLSPSPKQQFTDNSGNLAAGHKLYTYAAGTTNPLTTYKDRGGVSANTNPIILNSRGEATIYLQEDKSYDLKFESPDGSTTWTQAGVEAGDMLLRGDLAQESGAEMVGFEQFGSGAAKRTLRSKLRESVSILDFGGADDNSTDNTAAWNAAKAVVGSSGTVRFPKTSTGIYYFLSEVNFDGARIDNDEGVVFRMYPGTFDVSGTQNVTVRRQLRWQLDSLTSAYDYRISANNTKAQAEKRFFLRDADLDNSEGIAIDATSATLKHEYIDWNLSDTWVTFAPTATTVRSVTHNNAPVSRWYTSTTLVRGGDELVAAHTGAVDYMRMCVIRCVGGYYGVYADGSGGLPHLIGKQIGASATDITVGLNETLQTMPAYHGDSSVWTIRILNRRQFEVLFNGYSVGGIQTTATEIMRAGFGYLPNAAGNVNVVGWTKVRNRPIGGKRRMNITIYGDSMSAPIHGGWPDTMRETLDGSLGIRVDSIANKAIPGYTSGQALTKFQAEGTGGADVVVIAVGTNDIQGQTGVQVLCDNVQSMLALCSAGRAIPIIWIPPMWYTQQEAGLGKGQQSGNAHAGAEYRARLIRLCAENAVKCVDTTMVTGGIDSKYLLQYGTVGRDEVVRDNIHLTEYGYTLIGYAMARAIAQQWSSGYGRQYGPSGFQSNFYKNSWAANGVSPAGYTVSSDGMVKLHGVIDKAAGAVTDGTVIATLPEHLWPVAAGRFTAMTSNNTPCLLQVGAVGNLVIFGFPGASGWIALDGCAFQSAG